MSYVSNCCGKDIERPYPMYDIGDPTPYCSKCHKPCTPVEQKSGGEEEVMK